jgi:hypothetical protein
MLHTKNLNLSPKEGLLITLITSAAGALTINPQAIGFGDRRPHYWRPSAAFG